MSEPTPIPLPSVLDPDRGHLLGGENAADGPEDEVRQVRSALDEACTYGQELWQSVDSLRAYLLHSLPPDPRTPGLHRTGASPVGPDDEEGWQNWMAAYAQAHAVLAGPHGDSGFGTSEAEREAKLRRSAPNLRLAAEHPELVGARPRPARTTSVTASLPRLLGVAVTTLAVRALVARQLRRR